MAHDPRARGEAKPQRRADGVTIAPAQGARKTLLLLAGAAAVAAVAVLVLAGRPRDEAPAARAGEGPRDARVAVRLDAAPAAPPRRAHPVRVRESGPPPSEPARTDDAHEPIPIEPDAEPSPPTPSGIALFPPPGTDPPKQGIVVPEDFELPEGYVRHYQATDDGQALPPILMFHPDYDWVDETGAHVEVSENGVVPPEYAPEGMPIELLELPEAPSQP